MKNCEKRIHRGEEEKKKWKKWAKYQYKKENRHQNRNQWEKKNRTPQKKINITKSISKLQYPKIITQALFRLYVIKALFFIFFPPFWGRAARDFSERRPQKMITKAQFFYFFFLFRGEEPATSLSRDLCGLPQASTRRLTVLLRLY